MNRPRLRAALRKETLHFTVGTAVGLALIFLPRLTMLIVLAFLVFLMVGFEIVRFAVPSLNLRFLSWFSLVARKGEERKVTGSTYFLAAALVTLLVMPQHIAAASVLFLALGDPTGTVVGMWIGRIKLAGKSLEGHLACLAVCLAVGLILARVFPDLSLVMMIVGAVVATIFQALDLPLNDNITIALGSAIAMRLVGLLGLS